MKITDHHVHVGKDDKTGFSLEYNELINRMDRNKISRSVIFACPNVFQIIRNPYKESNNLVLRYASKNNRLLPMMFVNVNQDNLDYIANEHSNFLGFKLYSNVPGMATDYRNLRENEIIKFLMQTKKPLLFHTGLSDGERVRDLKPLISTTNSPVILAHCGRLFSQDLKEISAFDNTYIDISPLSTIIDNKDRFLPNKFEMDESITNLSSIGVLKYLNNKFNGRILWGSDSPWCDYLGRKGYEGETELVKTAFEEGITFADLF